MSQDQLCQGKDGRHALLAEQGMSRGRGKGLAAESQEKNRERPQECLLEKSAFKASTYEHGRTCTNLKNSMLSGRRQTQKVKYCGIPLYEMLRVSKCRDRKRLSGYQGQRGGEVRSGYFTGMGFYFGVMKSFGTR